MAQATALASLLASSTASATGTPTFTAVQNEAGIPDFTYGSVSNHSLGALWLDVDDDGWEDLLAVGGNGAHLFLNQGDGTFENATALLPAFDPMEMVGASYADYDRDGDVDIYIQVDADTFAIGGPNVLTAGPNLLLKNMFVENGHVLSYPMFEDVAVTAHVASTGRDFATSFLDYDRDGWPDIYVGRFVHAYAGQSCNQDVLYRNLGDGTFEDVTKDVGLDLSNDPENLSPALVLIGAHLDEDLWPDIYVTSNQYRALGSHFDLIWQNQGGTTFANVTPQSPGVGDDSQSPMGIDVADYDRDGYWDVFITDIYYTVYDARPLGNALYRGLGGGHFSENVSLDAGTNFGTIGWGANFFDVDNDGWVDLYEGTGRFVPDVVYMNQQDGTFQTYTNAITSTEHSRGSAVADYDHDGDLDIAIMHSDRYLELWRNDTATENWLELDLTGVVSNFDAIGCIVTIDIDGNTQKRQITGGVSLHSQNSGVVHFGLGNATTVDTVTVQWPNSDSETIYDVAANQRVSWAEGDFRDFDGDGWLGTEDNCPSIANPGQEDSDDDQLGDVCDPCPTEYGGDPDGDGLCPSEDPCPYDALNDPDEDGACQDVDNCPAISNPEQLDQDGDGQGDSCDPCPKDDENDADQDGLCLGEDPCPLDPDNDADQDGFCADADNCPTRANPDQADEDGDGRGDVCDLPQKEEAAPDAGAPEPDAGQTPGTDVKPTTSPGASPSDDTPDDPSDAGLDASTARHPLATSIRPEMRDQSPAPTSDPSAPGGCGCRTSGGGSKGAVWLSLGAAMTLLGRRRHQRPKRGGKCG